MAVASPGFSQKLSRVSLTWVSSRAVLHTFWTVRAHTSKEAMATCLKENMRTADCPACGWWGHVEDLDGSWRSTCPQGCSHEDGRPVGLRPLLHVPYDPDLYAELNVERFELGKTGKLLFSHPEGTHDDRFWALALAVYAAEMEPSPASRPLARTI